MTQTHKLVRAVAARIARSLYDEQAAGGLSEDEWVVLNWPVWVGPAEIAIHTTLDAAADYLEVIAGPERREIDAIEAIRAYPDIIRRGGIFPVDVPDIDPF